MANKPNVTVPVQVPAAIPLISVEVTLTDNTVEHFERAKDYRILSNGALYVQMEDNSSRVFNTPEWAEVKGDPVKEELKQ